MSAEQPPTDRVSKRSPTAPRFIAEWITKQFHDEETGEWEPDRDEYVGSTHATLEAAQAAALAESKKAGVVEWCRVSEERFDPELRIHWRSPAAWDTVRVWNGDWAGNWDEIHGY